MRFPLVPPVAGALTALAFAPVNLSLLPFLTFALLFHYCADKTPMQALRGGYLFGLGLFGCGVSWLHISINLFGGVHIIGAAALTLLMILFLSLYPALAAWLSRRLAPSGQTLSILLVMPLTWTLTEWLRAWLLTGFPWLSLGYSQIDTPLAAYATLGGVFLVSLLTLMLAAALLLMYRNSQMKQRLYLAGFCVLLLALGATLQQRDWTQADDATLQAALIQGAIPQQLKWLPEYRDPSLQLYLSLTEEHWGKDLIVWPETAIPLYYHDALPLLEQLQRLAVQHNSTLLTGLPIKDLDTGEYYNSILALGEQRQHYHKRHLVPFGEYVPLGFLFDDIVKMMQVPVSDFSTGDRSQPPLIYTPRAVLGMSICYENIFGNEIIAALPEAGLLVNVSNDAWFGELIAPHQHLQIARMRSLETGRYMLRGTNTGISAIIDEKGRIITRIEQLIADSTSATIKTFSGHTPYSRWGNYPLVILLCGLLLGLWVFKLRQPAPAHASDQAR
ncbi:MAG: apolipoprotein N-acyltransferase [Gammaproteobacteria bacterium]